MPEDSTRTLLLDSPESVRQEEAKLLQSVEKSEHNLGHQHPKTLLCISELGQFYCDQGHHQKAEECYLKVLETSERTLGDEHPYTLKCLNNLALVYRAQARYPEAESLYIRDLEAS